MKIFKIKCKIIEQACKYQIHKHSNSILINKIFKDSMDKVFQGLNLR